jgi:hypothetical protein
MSGTLAAQIVIPIVGLLALFGWLAAVLYANSHPGWKHHGNLPKNEVAGGAFQAIDGGRQLMPRFGGRPSAADGSAQATGVPAQRTAAEQEAAATTGQTTTDDRPLVAGSKLR